MSMDLQHHLHEFCYTFTHNLFKPLLLFFYMGFLVPILGVAFEFPYVIYQGLTIFLLISIGWEGGEKLAGLSTAALNQALGFMLIGFVLNFILGIIAYAILRTCTRLRRVDAATVAAYYGSDSAGTFATCLGVLGTLQLGTLVAALTLGDVEPAKLGLGKDITLDTLTNALDDDVVKARWQTSGVNAETVASAAKEAEQYRPAAYMPVLLAVMEIPGCLVGLFLVSRMRHAGMDRLGNMPDEPGYNPHAKPDMTVPGAAHGAHGKADESSIERDENGAAKAPPSIFSWTLFHEVFLNPGLFLLFGGIIVGWISALQGHAVVEKPNKVLVDLFQGLLCLFLLEMGMTASKRLRDLRTAGIPFILFGLIVPNLFATTGMCVAHAYALALGEQFSLGTYCLFAVLCGASSYIAVPAVQRLAIPEASPTLPLAASLGLTFSYNVTIGIPLYIEIAKALNSLFPHVSHAVS
jgi:hypothetical protein